MKTDTQRLDFLQRHPRCVKNICGGETPSWYAEQPWSRALNGKIFSSLRDAVDHAMAPASGIAPNELFVGDYCRADIPPVFAAKSKIRTCLVVEVHGYILRVQVPSRKELVSINRDAVVGLGWRKA